VGWAKVEAKDPVAGLLIYGNQVKGGIAGLPAETNPQNRQVLSHFHVSGEWYTGVVVVNPNPHEIAAVGLIAYDNAGNVKGYKDIQVPANGKMSRLLSAPDMFGSNFGSGWLDVRSNIPVLASEVYGNRVRGGLAALPSSEQTTSLILPHVVVGSPWWTGIAVVNTSNLPTILFCTAYFDTGVLAATSYATLPAKGKLLTFAEDLFDLPPSFVGWVQILSLSMDVAGTLVFGNNTTSPTKLAALPAMASDSILHFGAVRSDANWWTGISLVNPNEDFATVTLELLAPNGTVVDTKVRFVHPQGKITAFASSLFNLGGLTRGWIRATSDLPIVGLEVLDANDDVEQAWGLAAVPFLKLANTIYMQHYDTPSVWWTLFSLVNPSNTTQIRPQLRAYSNEGVFGGIANPNIPPRGMIMEMVPDLF